MRRFSLYRRGRIWYAQIFNPTTRKYLPGRPTGESDRRAAEHVADDWLRDGIPEPGVKHRRPAAEIFEIYALLQTIRKAPLTPADAERIVRALKDQGLIESVVVRPGSEGLIAFLRRFWDYETIPYVREKTAHGQRIGRRHCYDMLLWVKSLWQPYWGDRPLSEVCKADLKSFAMLLKEEKRLAAKTINNVLAAGTVAFRWARVNDILAADPSAGLMKFAGKTATRGVLTEQEVSKLFVVPWTDERSRVGNLLAMTTGLRAGEVLAIQVRDIADDRLHVRHSWSNLDGLKDTKTGLERTVPLLPAIRDILLDLAKRNPGGVGPASFVFWSSERVDRPMDFHFLLDGLRKALLRVSLSEEQLKDTQRVATAELYWRSRRVVFHSWRHYYAARMADRLESRKVMLATGHANGLVFEAYAAHGTEQILSEVAAATAEAFGKVLPFPSEI